MATENAQILVQDDASLMPQNVAQTLASQNSAETPAAPQAEPANQVIADAALPAPAKSQVQIEQERRLLAVRDINSKLGELDRHISRLTADFGQSQEALGGTLHDLQQRNTRLTSDLLGLVTRVELATREQRKATADVNGRLTQSLTALDGRLTASHTDLGKRLGESQAELRERLHESHSALDQRLNESVTDLNTRLSDSMSYVEDKLGQAGSSIRAQQARLDRLETTQEILQKLHDHLAAAAESHHEELRALAAETREQLQINRTHIQGLTALHREQKQALDDLTGDFSLLSSHTEQLTQRLEALATDTATHKLDTLKKFKQVAIGAAVLTVLVFAVMTWLQLHPSRIPEQVRAQIAALTTAVEHQAAAQQTLDANLQNVQTHLNSLDGAVNAQTAKIDAMNTAIDHASAMIRHMQKSESAMKMKMQKLQAQVNAQANTQQAAH